MEFFPASPWEFLWAQRERDWWTDNFEKKANIIAISMVAGHRKTATAEHYLSGSDSTVATRACELLASSSAEPSFSLMMGGPAAAGAVKPPPSDKQFDKAKPRGKAAVKPIANNPGDRCQFFNTPGGCKSKAPAGSMCTSNPSKRHTCSSCGGGHPATQCPKGKNNADHQEQKRRAGQDWSSNKGGGHKRSRGNAQRSR